MVSASKTGTPNKGGRPPFKPTAAQRDLVRMLKADGWSNERIARRIGIADHTLDKHFAQELRDGADHERAAALVLLKRAAKKGNVAAIKEYLRVIGIGGAIDDFMAAPDRAARVRPKGKKEVAQEEALHAHEAGEWGDDLAPIAGRAIN